jgi:hypothetical protein
MQSARVMRLGADDASMLSLVFEGNMFELKPAERMFFVRLMTLCDEMDQANTLERCNKINAARAASDE